MQALLDVIIPVFLVLGVGYLAAWRGYFSEANVDALMKFAQNFAIPCLLFKAMATIDLGQGFHLPLLFSFYIGASACFFLGAMGARLIFNRSWPDAVAIGFCCLYSNSLLLGLPITERAYGADALTGNFAIIAFYAPFCYLVGITTMELAKSTGQSILDSVGQVARAMFQNALILGIVLGLSVNLTGIELPGVLTDALDLLVSAAIPVALFGLGGMLVRYKPEGDLKVIAMVVGISLLVHPLITWATASALHLDQDGFRSVILTAAMAPGANAYLFANMYGAAKRVAATSVLLATAGSIISVWFWLLVLP